MYWKLFEELVVTLQISKLYYLTDKGFNISIGATVVH